jgi:sulfite exporter TauE/SafE
VLRERNSARDWVAVILALGIATAINMLMIAVLWDAVRSDTPGLSENSTQVIIAGFGGIVGILGGYLGGRAVERAQRDGDEREAAAARRDPPGSSLPGDPLS